MNFAPWTAKLRAWQERAFAAVMTHAGIDFLAMACPGAGKTTFGLRVAHQWLADRAVDRIVVVAPTNHLRGQWAQAAARVGLHLDPDLSNEQGVGRFVRMQSGLPPGQRASLYLPHDPILVEYARRIKAERDHALTAQAAEDRPRSLFDALESEGSLFEPLAGVARQETVIGHEEPMAEEASPAVPEAPSVPSAPPLHEQKEALRATHRALVGTIARAGGLKHDLINRELIRRTGTRIEQATVAQLRQRLRLLERWRDRGWEGG